MEGPTPPVVGREDTTDFFVPDEEEDEPRLSDKVESGEAARVVKSIVSGICDDIKTKEQLENFRVALLDHWRELSWENAPCQAQENPSGMVSLPNVQKKRKEERHKSLRSPPSKKGGTKKMWKYQADD